MVMGIPSVPLLGIEVTVATDLREPLSFAATTSALAATRELWLASMGASPFVAFLADRP